MELSWFSYTNFSHLPSWFVWCTVCSQIFFLSSPFPKLHFIYFFIFFFIFWYQPFASLLLLVLFHPSNLISLLFATLFPALPALLLTSWLNQFSKCVTAVWVWTMWQRTCLRGSISFPEASLSSAHHSQTILAPVPGGPTLQTELHSHIGRKPFSLENLQSKYGNKRISKTLLLLYYSSLSWEFNSDLVKCSVSC